MEGNANTCSVSLARVDCRRAIVFSQFRHLSQRKRMVVLLLVEDPYDRAQEEGSTRRRFPS